MDGKGYITVEDLVRIINMEQETFYRNRDLYLIFQRMTRKQGNKDSISLNSLIGLLDSRWFLIIVLSNYVIVTEIID